MVSIKVGKTLCHRRVRKLRNGVFLYKESSEGIGTDSETVMGTLKMLELFSYSETLPLVFVGLLSFDCEYSYELGKNSRL